MPITDLAVSFLDTLDIPTTKTITIQIIDCLQHPLQGEDLIVFTPWFFGHRLDTDTQLERLNHRGQGGQRSNTIGDSRHAFRKNTKEYTKILQYPQGLNIGSEYIRRMFNHMGTDNIVKRTVFASNRLIIANQIDTNDTPHTFNLRIAIF
ncbi:hypothetical protein D3C81_1011860 [compost metagenome]